MAPVAKYQGAVVEYLEQGRLRPALVVREAGESVQVLEASGREKTIARELVLLRHPERRADAANLAQVLTALEEERAQLRAELDLELLWQVVHEQGRSFSAAELSELFFGKRSSVATSVMLEGLLNDRLYFTRRHMEFVARSPEQVERLRTQNEKSRLRSDEYRKTQSLIRATIEGAIPRPAETAPLVEELSRYLNNPSTRSNELTTLLTQALPECDPAEVAFEILDRLGATPGVPRFACVGHLKMEFSEDAAREASEARAAAHPQLNDIVAITIDDEDTLEIDDAISCEITPDGGMRARTYIALVSDFVKRGGPMDKEAALRAATVYLPEATIRMLPDEISCRRASLVAEESRPVLVTEVMLSADGDLLSSSIFPATITVTARLDYDAADRLIAGAEGDSSPVSVTVARLHAMAQKLREKRRRAGAALFMRSEPKVRVSDGEIEIRLLDNSSPSRQMVAEFMLVSNYVAAKYAADNQIPIIYRVQPGLGGDLAAQRPRLSLYPELHAGIGMSHYAQLSSPIRRYADLVLQRQLVVALTGTGCLYRPDELLTVVAAMENVEAEGKELERRAKRYWILKYLERHQIDRELRAVVTRDGISAEITAFATRGALRGAPNLATGAKIIVEIARVDPVRGTLALNYRAPDTELADSPPR